MRPFLLFEKYSEQPTACSINKDELIKDLNLKYVFNAMAQEDNFIYHTAQAVLLNSLTDYDTIMYRQAVLKDCINNRELIKNLYSLAVKANDEAEYYIGFTKPNYARVMPVSVKVYHGAGLLEVLVEKLENLRSVVTASEPSVNSQGIKRLISQLESNLTEEFFKRVRKHILDLKSVNDSTKIIVSSGLGNGMKGCRHILRDITTASNSNATKRIFSKSGNKNTIELDNTSIINNAKEVEDAGLINILRLINHFNKIMLDFFTELRYECGFFVGCINLYSKLKQIKSEATFPIPSAMHNRDLIFTKLYDLSLMLKENINPVCNELNAPNANLFIITGANQGGKSTFLRSIGIAQLMLQCGMFVPAAYYSSNLCEKLLTHFTREEDAAMNSGKLDEELLRMNNLINQLTAHSMILMNEPFATTTEREGSKIASDIVTALNDNRVTILFVTHLYEFAELMYKKFSDTAVFLRAERNSNGTRSYCIKPGKPLQTSYGEDLLKEILPISTRNL